MRAFFYILLFPFLVCAETGSKKEAEAITGDHVSPSSRKVSPNILHNLPFHVDPNEVYKLPEAQEDIIKSLSGKGGTLSLYVAYWHAIRAYKHLFSEDRYYQLKTVNFLREKLSTIDPSPRDNAVIKKLSAQRSGNSTPGSAAHFYHIALKSIKEKNWEATSSALLSAIELGSIDAGTKFLDLISLDRIDVDKKKLTEVSKLTNRQGYAVSYIHIALASEHDDKEYAMTLAQKAMDLGDARGAHLLSKWSTGSDSEKYRKKAAGLGKPLATFKEALESL